MVNGIGQRFSSRESIQVDNDLPIVGPEGALEEEMASAQRSPKELSMVQGSGNDLKIASCSPCGGQQPC